MKDMTGENNPFYGKKHKEETKEKLRELARNREVSKETCLAISKSHMGEKNHMYGKHHTEEAKRKISEGKKGQRTRLGTKHKPEVIAKMSAIKMGNQYSKGHKMSEEARQRLSRERKGVYLKDKWSDFEYRDRNIRAIRAAQSVKPNKPETMMIGILNEIAPNEWKYVGDGQVVINGRIPDFININGKKQIIEVFGDYWHGERARCYEETEEGRIELFKLYGYSTLVVWESELKEPEQVKAKVEAFINKKGGKRT